MKDKNEISDWIILVGLLTILTAVLIPLLIISKYSFMTADDFSYMIHVGGVWKDNHSVFKTVIYAVNQSYETWKTWQGLYFADWLYFVVLPIFGENAYGVSAYMSLFSMVICEMLAAILIFHKVQGACISKALTAVLPIIILQIMLPPSGMEAFYWLISVILYTLIFSLSVLFCALLFAFVLNDKRINVIIGILIFVLAFCIAGSNYVTGLAILCVTGIVMIFAIVKKQNTVFAIILLIAYIAFFALSALSPGAGVRQASAGEGDTAVHAIIMSFVEAAKFVRMWTNLPVILMNASLVPLFIDMTGKSKIKFKLPWLVSILSFCVFASMFTSNLYALKIIGMYRVQNLYRFALYLLLPVNIWYWIGFIQRIIKEGKKDKNKDNKKEFNKYVYQTLKVLFAAGCSIAVLLMVYKYYGRTATPVSAYYSLREDEAKIYYEEWNERLEVYNDETVKDPVFEPYSRKPYLLFFTDISTDNTDWVNEAYARYFGKDSVTLSSD